MQALAKERVLIVDDEPQVLVALEDLLEDKFIVFKSNSGEAALEVIEREREIAVVITDQRMPRMTGDELLARLPDAADASRILVTGFADLSAVIRAVNEGKIFAYVTKPWDASDLRMKVDKAAAHFRLAHELANERQLLHDLMNNIPDAIYFKNRDLRFVRVNRAFTSLFQLHDPDSVVGKRLAELLLDMPGAESVEREERALLDGGPPMVDAIESAHLNGERHWFSSTKARICDYKGEVIGLVGIARDVTERLETGNALRVSEERFRNQSRILQSILDGIGEGVAATDRSGKFILFNQRAARMLGGAPREVPPADWAQTYGLFRRDETTPLPESENVLLRAIAGEEPAETEIFVRNQQLKGAALAVTATPLKEDDGTIAGGIALFRDVTMQRRLERQLAQAQKMEAIGRLAGGVAHDFNNLLSVIVSYTQFVHQELPEGGTHREDLAEVLGAAQRAAALTRQLLAFSRQQVVEPKTHQLNDLISGIERMLGRIIGEDIELVTELSPNLGLVVADSGQIEQILLNLTVNARDAMPDGGRLIIETSNVILDETYASAHADVIPGGYVMLAVTDTGTGIDPETQKRVFEPFFTTKEVGRGTGLGLFTVYGIVKQFGGHVWLYSELGRGTSFKIYLPRSDGEAETEAHTLAVKTGSRRAGTVLVLEDDDAVRNVAARILRSHGHTVYEASRASDARTICEEHPSGIDLLLTDVVMPEASGPKLAEELTQKWPRIRVLYMSGYPGAAALHGGQIGAGVAYITKPFTPAALIDKVREVLS